MVDFKIPSMSCGHCVGVVTQAVKSVDSSAEVSVDLPSHTVRVDTTKSREALAQALSRAGYAPA